MFIWKPIGSTKQIETSWRTQLGLEWPIWREDTKQISLPVEADSLLFLLTKIKSMSKNSLLPLRPQSKSEPKWPKDWLLWRTNVKTRGKHLSNMLLIESSKWRQMSLEKKKLISWLLDAKLKEKSNLWTKRVKLNNPLLRSRFTLSFGCLTKKRKFNENKERPMIKEQRFRKQLIFLPGRLTVEHNTLNPKKNRNFVSNKCWKHNGFKKSKPTRR